MTEMNKRCPRCGSEKRESYDYKSHRKTYKYMGEMKEYYVATNTYRCNECGLIYVQEER